MFNESRLRQNKVGHQLPWSDDELLAGLQKFYDDYGHYPSAGEVDTFAYLPSARSIQRTHGGLVTLRQRLLPDEDSDHTRGDRRRKIASEGDARARKYEEEFYIFLTKHFKEIAVHEHKIIRPGNVASDVFIYLNDSSADGIVIDLFYAQDLITLLKIVTIKNKRYKDLPFTVYFILVGNDGIQQTEIDSRIVNKKVPLPSHINVVTENTFKQNSIDELKLRSKFSR
jgi:hypothetical protein